MLVKNILTNMDKKLFTAMVAIDLSVAFDMVEHSILLDILNNKFGLDKTPLGWFRSYLHPRAFVVNINDTSSTQREVPFSVQGSVACPVSFNCYASTLLDAIR